MVNKPILLLVDEQLYCIVGKVGSAMISQVVVIKQVSWIDFWCVWCCVRYLVCWAKSESVWPLGCSCLLTVWTFTDKGPVTQSHAHVRGFVVVLSVGLRECFSNVSISSSRSFGRVNCVVVAVAHPLVRRVVLVIEMAYRSGSPRDRGRSWNLFVQMLNMNRAGSFVARDWVMVLAVLRGHWRRANSARRIRVVLMHKQVIVFMSHVASDHSGSVRWGDCLGSFFWRVGGTRRLGNGWLRHAGTGFIVATRVVIDVLRAVAGVRFEINLKQAIVEADTLLCFGQVVHRWVSSMPNPYWTTVNDDLERPPLRIKVALGATLSDLILKSLSIRDFRF